MSFLKHVLFGVFALLNLSLVIVLNVNSETIVQNLFTQKKWGELNQLADTNGQKSLDYYLGRAEDKFFGPVTNVISHIVFVMFAFLYLQKTSARVFALSVFVFLVISKWNVLFYPFYGDAIGGPFAEAWWLAQNNFDYAGLLQQPGYELGGPRVYFFSIFPTFLAILMKFAPTPQAFLIINHLIVFIEAALVVACVRQIAAKVLAEPIALMTSLLVLALPLFQSQTEAINMEMPCLLFSVWAVCFLIEKKWWPASICTIVAMLVKGHGMIAAGCVLVTMLGWLILDPRNLNKRFMSAALLPMGCSLLVVLSKFLLKDQHAAAGMIKLGAGLPSLKIMIIPHLYFVSLALLIGYVAWKKEKGESLLKAFWMRYYPQIVVFIMAGMWYLLFVNFYAVSPRYKLELAPFLVLCLVFVASLWLPKKDKLIPFLLAGAITISSWASFGLFESPLGASYHVLQERSLEYRNDLKLGIKTAKKMEERFPGFTIGAPFLVAQTLTIPHLGYVSKPLDVFVYGMPIAYGPMKAFEGLNKLNIMKTIWIGLPAQFINRNDFQYPIHPKDKIVDEIILGDNRLVLFMGGTSVEIMRYLTLQRQSQ
jgi:hypothetical protein